MEQQQQQPIIKIKSKDRPRKERYRDPSDDRKYQASERGREVHQKYKEANTDICDQRVERCQLRTRIEKKESLLSQIIKSSDLYKTTFESLQKNKERLQELEVILNKHKEETALKNKGKPRQRIKKLDEVLLI